MMLVVRGKSRGGTKRLDFQSDRNAMSVNYIVAVNLKDGFSKNIVHISFGIADCGKMRGG